MIRTARLGTVLLLLALACFAKRARADEHPVPLEKGVDAAKCLECHEDKSKGKNVHSAIAMGCTACHEVKVEGEVTKVDLNQPKNELCFTCHAKDVKDTDTQHGPYDKGQCVLCHDPHTSDYPKQLRAQGNALCLECHDARKGPIPETLTLFGSQQVKRSDLEGLRRLRLDADNTRGHPLGNHWVAKIADPTRPGQPMQCLTCHMPHTSPEDKLTRILTVKDQAGQEKKIDPCSACHDAYDRAAVENRARIAPLVEKQIQEQQKAAAKARDEYLKKLPKLSGDDRDKAK